LKTLVFQADGKQRAAAVGTSVLTGDTQSDRDCW